MKISANGIDVAEVQAQQLAADQAAVAAETASIKLGSTVLGQAGTWNQRVEVGLWNYDNYLDGVVSSNYFMIDYLNGLYHLGNCRLTGSAEFYPLGENYEDYFGVDASDSNNVMPSVYVDMYVTGANAGPALGFANCGIQSFTIGEYGSCNYDFTLDLSNNSIPEGGEFDDGSSGTVSGIINWAYDVAYNSWYLYACTLYLTGNDPVEAGGIVDLNGQDLDIEGWDINYDTYDMM